MFEWHSVLQNLGEEGKLVPPLHPQLFAQNIKLKRTVFRYSAHEPLGLWEGGAPAGLTMRHSGHEFGVRLCLSDRSEERETHAIQIGLETGVRALRHLLRGAVLERSLEGRGARITGEHHSRRRKVRQVVAGHCVTVKVHQYIFRLDVSMHNAPGLEELQAGQEALREDAPVRVVKLRVVGVKVLQRAVHALQHDGRDRFVAAQLFVMRLVDQGEAIERYDGRVQGRAGALKPRQYSGLFVDVRAFATGLRHLQGESGLPGGVAQVVNARVGAAA